MWYKIPVVLDWEDHIACDLHDIVWWSVRVRRTVVSIKQCMAAVYFVFLSQQQGHRRVTNGSVGSGSNDIRFSLAW